MSTMKNTQGTSKWVSFVGIQDRYKSQSQLMNWLFLLVSHWLNIFWSFRTNSTLFFSISGYAKKNANSPLWFYICVQLHTRCSISGFSIGSILFYFCFFQDLQFEIDTERENFLALTATGRKILKQMDDGSSGGASLEDAALIQRRLDTMNQRWNHLKAKSIAIR